MEQLIQTSNGIRKAELIEDKIIQQRCISFSLAAECFYTRLPQSFKDSFSLKVNAVPGFPGSSKNAFDEISTALSIYTDSLYKLENTIKHDTAEAFNSINQESNNFQSALQDAVSASKKLKKTTESQIQLSNKLNSSIKRLNDLVHKVIGKKHPSSKKIEEIHLIVADILRNRSQNHAAIQKIRSNQEKSITKFKTAIQSLGNLYRSRSLLIQDLCQNIILSFIQLTADTNITSSALRSASNKLDFAADLQQFSKSVGLVRQDIYVPSFKEIDVGETPTSEIPKNPFGNDFPIALARAERDFQPQGPNELKLTSKRMYYLLEPPDQEWCYVMNPFSAKKGFVPSQLLIVDCFALGILIKKPPKDVRVMIAKKQLVGIIGKKDGTENYLCRTIYGDELLLPIESVDILFSDHLQHFKD